MITRAGSGWQTVLADLSLILFIATVAVLPREDSATAKAIEASPQAEPLSVYRTGKDAPPLRQWLAAQDGDPRQLMTIVSTYRPGEQEGAILLAGKLAQQADAAGRSARIVVEPGDGAASVTLAFDQPGESLAHGLHEGQ